MIRSVVFDVGETLLDDTREWARCADWIGVPRHTFSAVLGVVTASGRNNAETFQCFRPGFDLAMERQRREEAGKFPDDSAWSDVTQAWFCDQVLHQITEILDYRCGSATSTTLHRHGLIVFARN